MTLPPTAEVVGKALWELAEADRYRRDLCREQCVVGMVAEADARFRAAQEQLLQLALLLYPDPAKRTPKGGS